MKLAETVTHKMTIKRFETLEDDFNKVHNNKYDYTNTVVYGGKVKIDITCPEHGVFSQRVDQHLAGSGCKLCGFKNMGKLQSKNKLQKLRDNFVEDSVKVHGNKYEYSKVSIKNRESSVIITCPVHGDFEQVVHNHLSGRGCKQCATEVTAAKRTENSWSNFLVQVRKVHGDLYSYCKSTYTNMRTPMDIHCSAHGIFKQAPTHHMGGSGCPECSRLEASNKMRESSKLTLETRVQAIHGGNYTLDMSTFTKMQEVMKVKCNVHNTILDIVPNTLLAGKGCKYCGEIKNQCNKTTLPTCLYYIKINNTTEGTLYKIGITSKRLIRRFSDEPNFKQDFEVLFQTPYMNRLDAVTAEQQILLDNKSKLLPLQTEILTHGNNELFSEDITTSILPYFNRFGNDINTEAGIRD